VVASQALRIVCPPRNEKRNSQPFTGVVPVFVMVTLTVGPFLVYATAQVPCGSYRPSFWSATNAETQDSGAFQLIVSSLVDQDSMSSM
jgi:hypothetical protein